LVEIEAEEDWEGGCMNLREVRVIFVVVTGVLVLLVASPALTSYLVWPRAEFFSEMSILDSNHMAENYPFNVSSGQSYSVYLGLGNQLGYCAYYLVEVKFRNETQPAPSSSGAVEGRSASGVPCLFNITAFVADQSDWEVLVTFGLDYGFNETLGQVDFHHMTFNANLLNLEGASTTWDANISRFYGDLVFELWLYKSATSSFGYHGRFVDLKLNMTVT
jgi:hypothetical protein